MVKESEGESSKPLKAEVAATHMNPLQLLSNKEVMVEKEPMNQEVLASILRGEFYQGGLMCAIAPPSRHLNFLPQILNITKHDLRSTYPLPLKSSNHCPFSLLARKL